MPRIKSKRQKLISYNEEYPNRYYDPEISLRNYFLKHNWNFDKAVKKAESKVDSIINQREYRSIKVTMYEHPMKTERPRVGVFSGNIYSPNAAANHRYFETAIKKIAKDIKLINTPAEIHIDAYLRMPNNVPPDEVILFESKILDVIDMPDYDNIGKAYTDLLKNVLITDDDIFHLGEIRKYYSVVPRVEFTITYQLSHDSQYIYKKIKNRKAIKEAVACGFVEIHKVDFIK